MTLPPTGLRWRKLDLHVHTPASADYTGSDRTPEAIVQKAIAAGVDGIAVTDHNTAAWIDRMVAAASKTPLAVFPGVEITASGAEAGIHIIGIFSRNTNTKTIEALLAKLDVSPEMQGKTEAISKKSPLEVVELIGESGGLAVLAHADSTKGVLHDMKGQQRTLVVQSPFLAAIEACNYEKTTPFLDGTDPTYQRAIATYRSSDNPNPSGQGGHSADGIGARYSWFKMDNVSLDALGQCFCDPAVRIIPDALSKESPDRMYPRIMRLHVDQGFLKGPAFEFHPGLNTIIGGKGVGKSLIVELLRFVLNQPSAIESIREDMKGKLEEQVKPGGVVAVELVLADGRQIDVERTYDSGSNPTLIRDRRTGDTLPAHIDQLFPILAYSQTEALEIARDRQAQLRLIDSFLDLAGLLRSTDDVRAQLEESDHALAEAVEASVTETERGRDVATLETKLVSIGAALKSERHDELQKLQPKTACLDAMAAHAVALQSCVDTLSGEFAEIEPVEVPKDVAADKELRALKVDLDELVRLVNADVNELTGTIKRFNTKLMKASRLWKQHVESRERAYREWAAMQGGDRGKLMASHKKVAADLATAKRATKAAHSKAEKLITIRARRAKMLAQLDQMESDLHQLRVDKYEGIATACGRRLQLELTRCGERGKYLSTLLALKKGTKMHESLSANMSETPIFPEFSVRG